MIDAIFEKRVKRPMQEINIVPILDMMTTIIFFLLMSTSFIAYTKLTVPPSATATVSGDKGPPPLQPRMTLTSASNHLTLKLAWQGSTPGESQKTVPAAAAGTASQELLEATKSLAAEFSKDHPKEKTIQISMEARVPYQHLVTLMDGVRPSLPDVVLVSYPGAGAATEAEE